VVGAPNDLLSVSGMVRLGYSFHFTPERSYVVTPELEILELLEKSGLYWLKWHRAVDPASAREQKHTMTCTRQTEDPSDEAADELSTIELPGQEKRGFHPDWKVETVGDHPDQKVETVGVHPDRKVETVGSIQIVAAAADQTGDRGDLSACDFCGATHQPGVPLSLLHRRLAHWNQDSIEKMVKNQSLDVKLTSKARCACEVCLTNKATRRHVSTEREQEADVELPFERVWTDVKGKVIPDLYGNRYMITFTCEVKRWTCVYFMKHKHEAKLRFKEFLQWCRIQGHTVRQLRSDGGGEYTADENARMMSDFQKLCAEHGIDHRLTSAHTPEMNGLSERLNRTLIEQARCLLHEAGLAREFWSFAVKHVAYVRNRLWHPKLESSAGVKCSPFQALYGRPPRISMLRVWGCDAWKLDHSFRSSSFGKKAKKCIFVGMSANRKGWVLFDPATRKTRTTFHCSFDESLEGRRCALRDFDLRQHKAGPGASRDDERLAKLERALYDGSADLPFEDDFEVVGQPSAETSAPVARGAEDNVEIVRRGSVLDGEEPVGLKPKSGRVDSDGDKARPGIGKTSRCTDSSSGGEGVVSESPQIVVPQRRAAIGAKQELSEGDLEFLKIAFDLDLPMEMQQKNPKRQRSDSRTRYEKYKAARCLRDVKRLGGSWADIVWDFERGYSDFGMTAARANFADLLERRLDRGISISSAAMVGDDGYVVASNPLGHLSYEESVRMDYAIMACEHLDSQSYRTRRLLQRALGNQSLEEFAHCCASRIMIPEPLNVKEAMASEHAAEWREAIQEEINTLAKFQCFEKVPRSEALKHGKLVKSKWVFKVKYEPDSESGELNLQRFKARLVAKGFTQVPGTDYYDTYSPVFSYTSLRTVLAIACNRGFQLDQWDLKSSFIQQQLDVEHMYLECPEGYDKLMPNGEPAALHCKQSIYGLKQSSRLLHKRLSEHLSSLGFRQLISDKCVFTKGTGDDQVIVCTWVDDIIVASAPSNHAARESFDMNLRNVFEVSPWTSGEAGWILNMSIKRDWKKGTLHLSQEGAIEKLATRFQLTGREGRAPHVPMSPTLKLKKAAGGDIVPPSEWDYQSAVGGLLYLSLTARPDIAQSVGVLSRFMSCPGKEHIEAAKQVIRYLYGTKSFGITYQRGVGGSPHLFVHTRKSSTAIDDPTTDSYLVGTYADADLAGDEGTRKSTNGHAMVLHGGVVSWLSKLQSTVALSTAEAETISGVEAVKQVIHLRLFLQELGQEQRGPSIVYEDNNAAISLAHGKEQSKRAKHYQLKVHFLNEQYAKGIFAYEKVDTNEQLADAFTKALPRDAFCRYREWMGVKAPVSGNETEGAEAELKT